MEGGDALNCVLAFVFCVWVRRGASKSCKYIVVSNLLINATGEPLVIFGRTG